MSDAQFYSESEQRPIGASQDPGPSHTSSEDPSSGAPSVRFEDLPREVGVMLVSVGALGVVLPAMAGAPAVVAGGLVLWPRTFRPVERWLEGRFPKVYHEGMKQVGRFLVDFERRFPGSTRSSLT